jgi:enamine deaminase RidA (YjgF/YER057c/UK114 family)
MDREMSRHHLFDPDGMAPAVGFSYGAVSAGGKLLHIAGLTGHLSDGSIADDLVEQFGAACESVAKVIDAAGGDPSDLVSMTIYTTDIDGYRRRLGAIGEAYRAVFGRHYPPMALFGISELFDPNALVELVCVAVVPD